MGKGYRVKVNGVYEDEMVGWQMWEEIGFTIMNPVCPSCKKVFRKGQQLVLLPGGITAHRACYPTEEKGEPVIVWTKDEYLATLSQDVEGFSAYIDKLNIEHPEAACRDMSKADWHEQFMLYLGIKQDER